MTSSTRTKAECSVPIYDGSGGPEVLESWILDMETWIGYDRRIPGPTIVIPNPLPNLEMEFARMKLTGLAQRLVEYRKADIKTWADIQRELRLEFYPNSFEVDPLDPYPSYQEDLKTKWLHLSQLSNTPVKDYIYQFKRLRNLPRKDADPKEKDPKYKLLIDKFINGLQDYHLYRELKNLDITTIDEAYRQALLAEEKISCKSTSSRTNGSSTISVSTKF